jgi:LCP family protein required for cell wall assembly
MAKRQAAPETRLRLTRRARIIGRGFFGAASALVLLASGVGWYLHDDVLGALSSSSAMAGLGGRSGGDVNILLMGLDSRKDLNGNDLPGAILDRLHAGSSSDVGGYNTNTLILLHVPADGSRAVALSIPRDDYVDLPDGMGEHKIKEAYGRAKAAAEDAAQAEGTTDRAGLELAGREAGRRAAVQAVDSFLGVTVDHFVEINLAGFYDLATALGGVPVCLREPAQDSYSGADFPAGVQTLDGAQSLAFVRQRHGLTNGDLDRTHRQQAFLASAAHKLQSEGVFEDLSKVQSLLNVARRDVVVDSGFDLLSFVQHAGSVASGNVEFYTLPIAGFATVNGEAVNLVDVEQVRKTTARLLAGLAPDDNSTGTARPGAPGPQIPQVQTTVPTPGERMAVESAKPLPGAEPLLAQGRGHPSVGAVAYRVGPRAGSGGSKGSSVPPGIPCVD